MNERFNERQHSVPSWVLVLGLVTLSVLALIAVIYSIPEAGVLAAFPVGLAASRSRAEGDDEPLDRGEFQKRVLSGVAELATDTRNLKSRTDKLEQVANEQADHLVSLRRARLTGSFTARRPGQVSDECARSLTASVVLHAERSGKLESFIPTASHRDSLLAEARSLVGSTRALSTTEVPLPEIYGSELVELIAEFGVVRRAMTIYPMAGGVAKPPRMGTRPAFGAIDMSGEVLEKKPTLTFASLEPHKLGGIVIVPTEIDTGSAVAMGQFLARYGAIEFARAEDTWGFLADGTATYGEIKGVCQIASENAKVIELAAGNTKPSDADLEDFREMRRLVSTGALSGARYFLNQSWESRLRAFNTAGDPYAFVYTPDGTARLDGFPITWTEVLQPYSTAAAASKNLAVFGNLRFWWMGQRGTPRIDTSEHVYFVYDQLATRFLELVDFDYASLEAASALKTPAA